MSGRVTGPLALLDAAARAVPSWTLRQLVAVLATSRDMGGELAAAWDRCDVPTVEAALRRWGDGQVGVYRAHLDLCGLGRAAIN